MRKKIFLLALSLTFTLTLSACTQETIAPTLENGNDPVLENNDSSLEKRCVDANGNWLYEYNECEGISEEWCIKEGGSYEQCVSACRHDKDSEFCIMLCVPICRF